MEITLKPVGVIRTPFTETKGMPIQGRFDDNARGAAEILPQYREGLKDLDGFSHAFLIFYFDRSKEERLVGKPFLEQVPRGIFSIRSPHRPNHLGLSLVRITEVRDDALVFSGVDMLDGTPLLDIKPYISHVDSRENVKNGWIEKHFQSGDIASRVRL